MTALAYLRSPLAIRARCEAIYEAGLAGTLAHFAIERDAIGGVVDRVVAQLRGTNPPVHGWMNSLAPDRVTAIDGKLAALPPEERARAWVDLVFAAVLLDGESAFERGAYSSDPAQLRVDALALAKLDGARERALAAAITGSPRFVGGRPGGLVDYVAKLGVVAIPAPEILHGLLEDLSGLWAGDELEGQPLGDVGKHPAAGGAGPTAGLVPFHERAQWLTYSLYEPLSRAGLTLEQAGALTGLPHALNGGLLVDLGVLAPKHERVCGETHGANDEIVVEWRALTVALLDRVADGVREKLGKPALQLPLACIIGATEAAGRAVAAEKRPDGSAPIRVR